MSEEIQASLKEEIIREVNVFRDQIGGGFRDQTLWRVYDLYKKLPEDVKDGEAGKSFYSTLMNVMDNPRHRTYDDELLSKAKTMLGM